MNKNQDFVFKQIATGLMLLTALTVSLSPFGMSALDRQVLPNDTAAKSGWTHVMDLKYSDVTNGLTHNLWRLYPGSGNGALGDCIDAVGVFLESPFYVTNANAGSNAVKLNVGFANSTNSLINNWEVGSNYSQLVFITNTPPIACLSAATNFWVVSLTYSNTEMALSNIVGEAHIFFRVRQMNRLKNY
jgi:hypothetical protein